MINTIEELEEVIDMDSYLQNFINDYIREYYIGPRLGEIMSDIINGDDNAEENIVSSSEISLASSSVEEGLDKFFEYETENIIKLVLEKLKHDNIEVTVEVVNEYVEDYISGHSSDFVDEFSDKLNTLDKETWLAILSDELSDRLSHTIDDIRDIEFVDDEIGDEIYLLDVLDLGNREVPFVYIDGDIAWGWNSECTHIQAINNYNIENGIEPLEETFGRGPGLLEIERKHKYKNMAFGHYGSNCAFIEGTLMGNPTMKEITESLLEQNEFVIDKIYIYYPSKYTATRIATKRLASQITNLDELEIILKEKGV